MNYAALLLKSKEMLDKNPQQIKHVFSINIFSKGAQWMHEQLNAMSDEKTVFNKAAHYNAWGILKYSICLAGMIISGLLFYRLHYLLTPLCILIFYFFEVQLLFLFPLLIDGTASPLKASIRITHQIGIIKAMCTVIPVSMFMLAGLLNFNSAIRNWHIGSLAIIIWYQHEIRNRIH